MNGPDLSLLGQPLPYLLRAGEVRRKERGFAAQCIAFLDRSTIEMHLDVTVGVEGWQTRLEQFGSDGAVRCSLGLLSGGGWMWRHDIGYPEGGFWPAASAGTYAFKRAAERWGVGRFLRGLPQPWLPCKVRLVKGEGKAKIPTFAAWDCDPEDRMEAAIAARRGSSSRLFDVIAEHKIPQVEIARWCLAQNCRDLRELSIAQRGQLESLIISGHFNGVAHAAQA